MPISDLLASITGEPSPTTSQFPPPKRKADNDLRRPVEKSQKTVSQIANSSRPMEQSPKSQVTVSTTSKARAVQNGRPAIQNSATSQFKNGQPTPPPMNEPPKPPKKGSFAEIMARGKAAQSVLGQVGKIQHKKIEKPPSKREQAAMLARKGKSIEKGLDPKGKFGGAIPARIHDGKNGVENEVKSSVKGGFSKPLEPVKKVKKAATATTGYAGTARPKAGGSSRPPLPSSRDRGRASDRPSSRRYEYVSEEEEEEIEEQEDYYSDESDMEAAAFEVDEEEELAARLARKEDAEALAEENRLKREKLEKKRRLEALAKKAPGQRY